MLSKSQMDAFNEHGYLPLGQIMSSEQLDALRRRLEDLTHARILNERIHFQLEAVHREHMGIAGPYGFAGPSDYYRKLTHLDEDALFREYFVHAEFRSLLRQLIGPRVAIFRAFAMLKPAFDGSPLHWHQDVDRGNPFAQQRGRFVTVWTAVDDADARNGALLVLPGTHQQAVLDRVEIDALVDRGGGQQVLLKARAGEAFLLDNFLLHCSGPNQTDGHRRAVTICYHDVSAPMPPTIPPQWPRHLIECGS